MKKSIKILSLVLAVALICGAFIVGAFAASVTEYQVATGEKFSHAYDFESADWADKKYAGKDLAAANSTEAAAGNVTIAGMSVCIKGRNGTFEIVESEYEKNGKGNSYVLFTDNSKQVGGAYIAGARTSTPDVNNTFAAYYVQTFDFDVFLPTGIAPKNWDLMMYMKYLNTDGGAGYSSAAQGYYVLRGTADGNISAGDSTGEKYKLSTDGWSHVTAMIVAQPIWVDASGNEVAEGTEGAYPAANLVNYIAVNGVIVSESAGKNTAKYVLPAEMKDKNARHWFGFEPKINFPAGDNNGQLALDNLIWRQYSAAYADIADLDAAIAAGVGASLTNWDGNLYKKADLPFGKLIATNGDANYDDLQAAVDNAKPGDTITLQSSVTSPVTVNRQITIAKNGFTANLVADGVAVNETDTAYEFSPTSAIAGIEVKECTCGNNCFGAEDGVSYVELTPGANIISGLVNALGELKCEYVKDDVKYTIKGFTVVEVWDVDNVVLPEGTFIKLDSTAIIPETISGDTAGMTLKVEYDVSAPIFKTFDKDGNQIGVYYAGTTLRSVITSATTDTTIKFLADYTVADDENATGSIGINGNLTLDLNGYSWKGVYVATAKHNKQWFSVGANEKLTITSSRVGGKMFDMVYDSAKQKFVASDGLITTGGSNCTVEFKGKDADGNSTLAVYAAMVISNYSDHKVKFYVDGGEYYRTASDNMGFFWFNHVVEASFKNATIAGVQAETISNIGRYQSEKGYITIDNCVLTGTIAKHGSDNIIVTVTNSYINGTLNPTTENSSYASSIEAPTGDEWTIGKGCYISSGATVSGVVYEETPSEINKTVTQTLNANKFDKTGPCTLDSAYVITTETKEVTYTKYIAETITVKWSVGGEIVGETKVVPGMNTTSPVLGLVDGTMDMISYKAIASIPADTKDGDIIEVTDDMERVYDVNKVPAQFNFSMTAHFAFNFYVPVIEGVEYGQVYITLTSQNRSFSGNYIDGDGNEWVRANIWPGPIKADKNFTITINFTYKGQQLSYTTAEFSLAMYAERLIDREISGSALKNVMADVLRYIDAVHGMVGETVEPEFAAIYNKDIIQKNLSAIPTTGEASNKDVLAKMKEDGYINTVAVATQPDTSIYAATILVTTNGGTYSVKSTPKGGSSTAKYKDGVGYYAHDLRTYALNDIIVIEVYENADFTGAVLATYEWTVAGYMNDHASEFTAAQAAFANAVYAYAASGDKYNVWKNAVRS